MSDKWSADLPKIPGWYWMLERGKYVVPVEIFQDKRGRWIEKIAGGHRTLSQGKRRFVLWSPMQPPPELPQDLPEYMYGPKGSGG